MIVPASTEYITFGDYDTLEVGDYLEIDSNVGGSHTVEVLEKTADSITVQPIQSWWWEGTKRPIYTYTKSEAREKLFFLPPANSSCREWWQETINKKAHTDKRARTIHKILTNREDKRP